MTEKTFTVEGMSCGHCKAAVEEELNRLSGVERSNADFERGTVEVAYDEDSVTTEDIRRAVEEAGYTLTV
jgi:copper chaperone